MGILKVLLTIKAFYEMKNKILLSQYSCEHIQTWILVIVGIDHVFAPGAGVGRATTHDWGRPS